MWVSDNSGAIKSPPGLSEDFVSWQTYFLNDFFPTLWQSQTIPASKKFSCISLVNHLNIHDLKSRFSSSLPQFSRIEPRSLCIIHLDADCIDLIYYLHTQFNIKTPSCASTPVLQGTKHRFIDWHNHEEAEIKGYHSLSPVLKIL